MLKVTPIVSMVATAIGIGMYAHTHNIVCMNLDMTQSHGNKAIFRVMMYNLVPTI